MFCSNCGNKLAEGARFCSFCGSKVEMPAERDIRTVANIDFREPELGPEAFDLPSDRIIDEAPEKPVRERMAFDWSNVVEEPRRRDLSEIRSPWDTSESEGKKEKKAETDFRIDPVPKPERSRTMSFIDVLKAEKAEKEKEAAEKAIEYTQVLEIGPELEAFDEAPKLHFAPLYENVDEHVVSPFDEPVKEPENEPEIPEEPEAPAEPEEAAEPDVPAMTEEAAEAEAPAEQEAPSIEPELPLIEPVIPVKEPEIPDVEVSRETIAQFDEYVRNFEREAGITTEPELEIGIPETESTAAQMPKFELPDFLKNIGGRSSAFTEEPAFEEPFEETEAETPSEDLLSSGSDAEELPSLEPDAAEPELETEALFEEPVFEDFDEKEENAFAEVPVFEEPKFEEPLFEEPAFDEPEFEEPVFEEPVYEQSAFEAPELDWSDAEEPLFEEPLFAEPSIEESAEDGSAAAAAEGAETDAAAAEAAETEAAPAAAELDISLPVEEEAVPEAAPAADAVAKKATEGAEADAEAAEGTEADAEAAEDAEGAKAGAAGAESAEIEAAPAAAELDISLPVEEEAIPEAAPAVDAEVKEAACDTEVNAEAAEDAEGAKADAEGAEAAEIEAAPAAAEPEKVAEEEPADEVEDTAPAEPAFEETVEEPEPDLEDIYLDMDLDSIDSARAAHSGRSEYRAYDTDLYDDINDTEEAEVTEAAEEAAESAEADGFELIDELEKAGEAEAADEEATEEPATDAAAEEPAEQEYEEAVDDLEEELFREMEESSPKKTGMTIAGPADTESEIEALKKRLAELMGNAPEETEVIEETVPEEAKADFRFSEVPSSGVDELFEGLSSEQEAEPSAGDEPAEDEDGDKGSMAGFTFDPIVTPEVDELFEGLTEEGRAAMEDGAGDEHLAASLDGASGESGAESAEPVIEELEEASKEPEGGYSIDDLFKGLTPISEQTMDSAPVDLEAAARAARAEASPAAEAPVIELAPVGEIRIAAEPEAEAPSVSAEPAPAMSVDELLKGLSTEVGVAAPAAYAEADVKAETDTKTEIDAKPEAEAEAAVSAADDDDRASDALSLEELEINLFGEVPSAEVEAEETKKIDKFYTLYRKNEEFQRLLDEEYDRLRNGGREAAKPEAVSNAPKEEPSVVRIEDNKAYRQVEDETIYMPKELLEKEVAAEVAAIKAAPQEISAGTKAPVEITEFSASGGGAVDKKAAKAAAKAEKARLKEEKRRAKAGLPAESGADGSDDFGDVESGSGFLTVLAVIIAIILVMLLAVIIVLQVAPDSGAAAWINELIGRITQSIGLLEPFDGQTLL